MKSIPIIIDDPGPPTMTSQRLALRNTLIALLAFTLSTTLNYVVLAWVHDRVPYGADPLPDIFFTLVDEYPRAITLAECLLVASVAATLLICIFHKHRWIVLRRLCVVASCCYTLRAICVAATQVPVPSRRTYCGPVAADSPGLFLIFRRTINAALTGGLNLYRPRVLCGDLIFSGHTVVFALSHLIADRYSPPAVKIYVSAATKLSAIVGPICILLARKHYTLDVILAYVICYLTFTGYHCAIDGTEDKNNTANIFHRLITYLENDLHKKHIDNEFGSWFRFKRREIYVIV